MNQEIFTKEYKERKVFKRAVITASVFLNIAVLSAIVYWIFKYLVPADKVSEFYTDKLFYFISYPIKKMISFFPFSVMELLLYVCAAAFIITFMKTVLKTIVNIRIYANQKRCGAPIGKMSVLRPSAQFGLRIITVICAALSAFILFGGINYNSLTFAEKAGYVLEESDAAELKQLCKKLSQQVSLARNAVEINADGSIDEEFSDYNLYKLIDDAIQSYQNLPEEYNFLKKDYPPVKPAVSSFIMSNIHITGIYPYILPEAIINADQPIMSLPHTICHEMAHQRGYAREDEANYIAFLACVYSDNPLFVYSGYYTAFTYAMNALHGSDQKGWSEISAKTSQAVWGDVQRESSFWKQYETISSNFTSSINDTYLSTMDVEDGVRSYGRMVDLMLAEAKRDGIIR